MKLSAIMIITVLIMLLFYNESNCKYLIDSSSLMKNTNSGNEKFHSFLVEFSCDSVFQISRIKFPLKSYGYLIGDFDNVDTLIYEKKQWQYINLLGNMEYVPQIYNNFECEIKDTDERVFAYEGIENGINIKYFFKRINGKWFLLKIEDFST